MNVKASGRQYEHVPRGEGREVSMKDRLWAAELGKSRQVWASLGKSVQVCGDRHS